MNSINNTESANQIGYNNTESGLTATDVQGAVDELMSSLIARDKIAQYPYNASTMTDFNNFVTDKAITIYQIGTTANMGNKPQQGNTYGVLIVFRVSYYIAQLWLEYGSGAILHRVYNGTVWSNWL